MWAWARARPALAHDAAVATLYGAITAVPTALVAVRVATGVLGEQQVDAFGDALASALPEGSGPAAVRGLVAAGQLITLPTVVLALDAGSAYGLGLSATMRAAVPPDEPVGRRPRWWVRATTVPLLGLGPLLLLALLGVAPLLDRLPATSGAAGTAAAVYISLTVVWVLTWAPLTWVFRVVGPGRPSLRAAFAGAVISGAFVSGFLQGFVLVHALPEGIARPFGGLLAATYVILLLLWAWVLHIVLLLGYAWAWAYDAGLDGPPAGRPAPSVRVS